MRVSNSKSLVFHIMILLLFFAFIQLSESRQKWTVSVSESLQLACTRDQNRVSNWKHNEVVLFIDNLRISFNLDHIKLLENYSLLIQQATLRHEGIYQCLQNDKPVAEFMLKVEVPPKMFLTINDLYNVTYINVEAGTNVTLYCNAVGARPSVNLSWTADEENDNCHTFNFTVRESREYEGEQMFDSVSALRITLTRENGTITCRSRTQSGLANREIRLHYNTYVLPNLHISIDGISGIDGILVAAYQPVRVVCNASAARPNSHISWRVNNLPIESLEEVNETSTYAEKDDAAIDTVSTMWYRPKDVNGSITCTSQLDSTGETARVHATYFTYVVPDMYFTINGNKWRNISTINVSLHQTMNLTCHADGARPMVQLMWKLNTRNVDTNSVSIRNIDDQTYNITTFLNFHPNETETVITCFMRGLLDHNIFILATIRVTAKTDSYQEDTQSLTMFGIILILLLIAALSFMFVLRKYFGSRSSHSLHQYEAHLNTNTNINQSSLSGNNTRKCVLEGLDLPEVPGETNISDYGPFSEDDYDSYFELKEKSSHHRMFPSNDMCLILSMNSGHLQSRWMGTISLSKHHKKCVVFSTVNDVIVKNGEIQWDSYVKRVLDMPDHKSLVKLQGICVNQANLFLVHEHLTCDSLECIINSKRTADNRHGTLPTPKVTSYLMEILEGMEVLHSFGFLHPGISTKKVLVTDSGHCKLYDFSLSEDASNKTSCMKSKKDCSISDLPPEALLRNEYTQASDVWCVAVVLWNLMTYDPIPVLLQTLDERKVSSITQEWPTSHPHLKNHILFECWIYDDSFRPSINKLRSSFAMVFGKLKAFTSSEDLKDSMTDLYIPMNG